MSLASMLELPSFEAISAYTKQEILPLELNPMTDFANDRKCGFYYDLRDFCQHYVLRLFER